ncbi:hypothetical protein D3C73_1537420 [compost metagenome]
MPLAIAPSVFIEQGTITMPSVLKEPLATGANRSELCRSVPYCSSSCSSTPHSYFITFSPAAVAMI